MNKEFDFLCDTILHVSEVSENMEIIASELRKRGISHDRTKFQSLEFDAFVSTREQFKRANYGTPEGLRQRSQTCCGSPPPKQSPPYWVSSKWRK